MRLLTFLLVLLPSLALADPMVPPQIQVTLGSTTKSVRKVVFGSGLSGSFDGGTAIVLGAASCSTCLYSGTDVAVQSVTVTQNDGGTAQRAAVYARNLTPATASNPVQQPGCIELEGQAWGGDGGSTTTKAALCWVPAAGASKPAVTGHWIVKVLDGTGTWSDRVTLNRLPVEIAAAGRSSSYSAVHTVAGAFAFAASDYTVGSATPTMTFRSVAAMGTAGVTGYVALYNATDGETVATQTITATDTTATDTALTVGTGAGNVKPATRIYEIHIYTAPVDGGTVADTIEHYSSTIRVAN